MNSIQPEITGVICTHNRERFIKRCILSLLKQSLPEHQYEIIVVDNGSTDNTRKICQTFKDIPNFSYIYESRLGLSQARNTGWHHAKGKYVGYLDDDATAAESWFEKALWSFKNVHPTPEWVGGPIELEWEAPAPTWIDEECQTTLGRVDWGQQARFLDRPNERLGGGNSFYQKSVLGTMHGFDTRLGRKKNLLLSGEETQLQHKIKNRGGRLYYHPGIRIFHFVPVERMRPQFFYKRYYWGGVTDFIIKNTVEKSAFVPICEEKRDRSKFERLIANLMKTIGVSGTKDQMIQSRIYFAYVLGSIAALLKYRRIFNKQEEL